MPLPTRNVSHTMTGFDRLLCCFFFGGGGGKGGKCSGGQIYPCKEYFNLSVAQIKKEIVITSATTTRCATQYTFMRRIYASPTPTLGEAPLGKSTTTRDL